MDLFNKAIQGDSEAIYQIYEHYKRLIYKKCYKYAVYRHSIEYILQEAYFPFLAALQSYSDDKNCKFSTYLCKYLNWYFIRYLRNDKNKADLYVLDSPLSDDTDTSLIDTLADDTDPATDTVLDNVYYSDFRKAVLKALNTPEFTETQRQVTVMYWLDGLSLRETADKLAVSMEYVRAQKEKALRRLRKLSNTELMSYRDDIIDRSVRFTGLTHFQNTGTSSVEWAVMKLDK